MTPRFRAFQHGSTVIAGLVAALLITGCGADSSSSDSGSGGTLIADTPSNSLAAPTVKGGSTGVSGSADVAMGGSDGSASSSGEPADSAAGGSADSSAEGSADSSAGAPSDGSSDAPAGGASVGSEGSAEASAGTPPPGLKTITPGTLLVGTMSDAKPNAYLEDGKWKGFDLDLIKAIAESNGLKVEYRAMDFSALFPAAQSGRLDIVAASTAGTIERQKIVGFSKGYLIGYLGVLTKKDSGITDKPESTKGKRIGLLQGSIQEGYAKRDMPDATVVTFPDNNSGVAALNTGRIDGYFLDYVVGVQYLAQYKNLVQPLSFPAFDLPAAFPIAKENAPLREMVDRSIAEQVANGNYLKLYKKYFPGIPVPEQLPPYDLPTS